MVFVIEILMCRELFLSCLTRLGAKKYVLEITYIGATYLEVRLF